MRAERVRNDSISRCIQGWSYSGSCHTYTIVTQPSPLICYTKNPTFLSTLKPRPSAEDPRGVFEPPPLSPHRPGVCSFTPNAEMQQQNQPSSQTLHRQRKDSSTPQPAGNQHLYAKETRLSLLHHTEPQLGKGLAAGPPGIVRNSTVPLQLLWATSAKQSISHQQFLAPHLIIHTKHLHFSPTFGSTWGQNTSPQWANLWPAADPVLTVSPCQSLLVQEQSHGTNTCCHSSQSFPSSRHSRWSSPGCTTHCSAPFHGKSDPGAGELLWGSAEPQEMQTRCEDTPKGNDPQGFTTTTVCSSKQMVLSVTCQSG